MLTLKIHVFKPIQIFSFILLFFQMYAVLCVISQYQELMAGRGTARFEQTLKVNIKKPLIISETLYLRENLVYLKKRPNNIYFK